MANLTRFEPFDLTFEPLERLFHGWLRPMRMMGVDIPRIRMDVTEDDRAYVVRAEIPGVERDAIDVRVEGNRVTVSAEVKQEQESKAGAAMLCSERDFGVTRRSFTLDNAVVESEVTAKYEDGILTVNLPKKEEKAGRKVAIN